MKIRSIRRSWLIGFVVVAFSASASLAGADTAKSKPSRPNILVIVGDDMGYADIGVHGCKDIPTPHIDSLAKNGVQCRNGYVSGPYCSPTRAGLLTGRYQQRFGHEFNPGPPADANIDVGLPVQETTIADRLNAAGYATGMVGKWHLGHAEKFHPLSRGFQEYFGFLGGAHSYLTDGRSILRGREAVSEPNYLTDAFAREALAFLDRQAATDKPFFLY
jgi:arylsulfatase A-like enzyme